MNDAPHFRRGWQCSDCDRIVRAETPPKRCPNCDRAGHGFKRI